jgi:uncharacterized protein (DUF433 family)
MPVAQILEMLSQGMTHEEILEDYPYLDKRTYSQCYALPHENMTSMLTNTDSHQ